jgi:hypothetical protein
MGCRSSEIGVLFGRSTARATGFFQHARVEEVGGRRRFPGVDLVAILRMLWLRRSFVGLTLLIALSVGVLVAYRVTVSPLKLESRQYTVGIAAARVLIDTPQSKVVDLGAAGADYSALGGRASLLANLMASGPVKTAIARRAGVSPDTFSAIPPVPTGAAASRPEPTPADGGDDANALILTIQTETDVPIISFQSQAPDAAGAARLANGAVDGLRDYLGSVAAAQKVPQARQLVATELGRARAGTVVRGRSRIFAVMGALVVFALMCGVAVVLPGIERRWGAIAADEQARAAGANAQSPEREGKPDADALAA